MKKFVATEACEQRALKKYCTFKRILLIHIQNEGNRTKIGYCQKKLEGVSRGFPDNILILQNQKIIFVELKKNCSYTKSQMKTPTWLSQEEWIKTLNSRGHAAKMCFGWEQARLFIEMHE